MSALGKLETRLPPLEVPKPPAAVVRLSGPLPALPKHLERMLSEPVGPDRSGQTHALVAASLEWGLDDGQVLSLLGSHAPSAEKYGKRLDAEVERVLSKVRPDHQHPGQPCDKAGCANRPRWMTGQDLTWIAPRPGPAGQIEEVAEKEIPEVDPDGFWRERPVLEHLLTFARSRLVSPWAMLGVSLVRVLAVVPPHVVLPALVGSHAGLNTFVGLVGASGGGKGAAEGASSDALDVGSVDTHSAGSGEGLLHLYVHREKTELVQHRTAVVLSVPEVDTLVALKSRQGATLLPILRSAWSGEQLAFGYADPDKALLLQRHSYRLGLILGIQPGRAAPLLDDTDGGTPQRFLWLPTTDTRMPDNSPDTPPRRRVQQHNWFSHGLHVLTVPDVARQAVQDNRRAVVRGQTDALDGHALLARLKLAQALALLDDRQVMTDDDWRMSGLVQAVSDRTRAGVQRHLATQARTGNLARAQSEGERAAVVEDVAAEHAVKRCARLVVRHLTGRDEVARGEVRKALPSRDRRWFDESVGLLVAAGQVAVEDSIHGDRLRLLAVGK